MLNKLSKLFTPKAPPAFNPEEGVTYQVSFPPDFTKPKDGAPTLESAITRVKAECQELRAVIEAAKDCRSVSAIDIEIGNVKELLAKQRKDIEFARAQCRSGFISEQDIIPVQDKWESTHTMFRKLHAELEARNKADAASVALKLVLGDIQ